MISNIYCISDAISGQCAGVFTAVNDNDAIRMFGSAVAYLADVPRYLDDLILKRLGTFEIDDLEHRVRGLDTGVFVARGSSPCVTFYFDPKEVDDPGNSCESKVLSPESSSCTCGD